MKLVNACALLLSLLVVSVEANEVRVRRVKGASSLGGTRRLGKKDTSVGGKKDDAADFSSEAPSSSPTAQSTPTPDGSVDGTNLTPVSSPIAGPGIVPRASVEVLPLDGSDCWNSTVEVTLTDLVFFLTDPTFDVNVTRIYTFCPGSTMGVGYISPGGPLGFQLVGGDLPIIVLNPNVHLRCGAAGESSNNCTIHGGQEHITSQSDTVLLEILLPFLPFLVPGLPALPALPDDYTPDSSNLLVEGFTFSKSANFQEDDLNHSSIFFPGPGTDMLIRDCIFKDNAAAGSAQVAAQSAISLSRAADAQIANGPYNSLTVVDSTFEDNTFTDAVIITRFEGIAQDNNNPSLIELTVRRCVFEENILEGPFPTVAVIHTTLHTTVTIEDCCFFSNNVAGRETLLRNTAIVSTLDSFLSFANLCGLYNVHPFTATCPDIAQYTLDATLSQIASTACLSFDAPECIT